MGGLTLVVVGSLVLAPLMAGAQTNEPVARADVAVATGWFVADRAITPSCCTSWSAGLFKGASAGYYWTDHLKTEGEVAAPGTTRGFTGTSERLANNTYRYTSEDHTITAGRVSISQSYQFGRNAMYHPFVRAGVDVDREHDVIARYISSPGSATSERAVEETTRIRPFVGAGFKAYFNERVFFRGDARFNPGRGEIEQMVWTAGVGIDFSGRRRSNAPTNARPSAGSSVPRAQEPVESWRELAAKLRIGARIDVATAGGNRFVGDLIAVDSTSLTVKPAGRLSEPPRRIPFDQLERLALHSGPAPGTRAGASLVGVGTGAGVFMTLLMVTLALFAD